MSYQEAFQPECESSAGVVDLFIKPKQKDLGEFTVRRVLPAPRRRMVGPFIFFDHMGPAEFPPGQGIQVRPHPHIGIATITYLFEGEIMHADSLGFRQPILAGAVNLMTAGRGIVHSERAGSDLHSHAKLHGIQSWIALPEGQEEIEPAFVHTPASDLPELKHGGATVRIIMGEALGQRSPVHTYSSTLYLDCQMPQDSAFPLPENSAETALYVASGTIRVAGNLVPEGVMLVACPGANATIEATQDSRVMIIGGDAVGKRHIWWNFVSSSKERIEQAKVDWQAGNFEAVPDDDEYIPLPG